MKVGDLVRYAYGSAKRTKDEPCTIERGDVGVIMSFDPSFNEDKVVNVFFFTANYTKKSFGKYLEVVSEGKIAQ